MGFCEGCDGVGCLTPRMVCDLCDSQGHSLAAEIKTLHELLGLLSSHVGETGESEGAVDVLKRLIQERDDAHRAIEDLKDIAQTFEDAAETLEQEHATALPAAIAADRARIAQAIREEQSAFDYRTPESAIAILARLLRVVEGGNGN